jgi:hypothetical protein
MSPRLLTLGALAGGTLLACTGTLEHEPSAYFGGVSVTDSGPGRAVPADAAAPKATPPPDYRPPPAPAPDASPLWEPDAGAVVYWDAPPAAPDLMVQGPPLMPDAAAIPSACAPGPDALALLSMRCGGCHNATSPAKGLDLRSPGVGARTVNVASSCQGRPLLGSGPRVAGHLLDKLEGPVPGCGNQMPAGGPALSEQEKACLREWAGQAITKVTGREVVP